MATEIRNDITQFVLWYNNLPAYIKHVSHMLAVVKRATMCQGVSVECHVWTFGLTGTPLLLRVILDHCHQIRKKESRWTEGARRCC